MTIDEAIALANGIFGWMDVPDLRWLYNTAENVPNLGTIVEVGSWLGKSTTAIVSGAKTKNIIVVDKWEGSISDNKGDYFFDGSGIPKNKDEAILIFLRNIKRTEFVPTMIVEDSWKAAERIPDNYIDFLFIDADHSYESVKKDISAWYPKVKSGGIVSGHDWNTKGGVRPAVIECIPGRKINVTECNIWWIIK